VHASGVEGAEAARLVARRGARAVAASPRLAVSKVRERVTRETGCEDERGLQGVRDTRAGYVLGLHCRIADGLSDRSIPLLLHLLTNASRKLLSLGSLCH
jgi:hypothetical protein